MINNQKDGENSASGFRPDSDKVNIPDHSKSDFQAMIDDCMKNGGLGLTACKGYGKSRFLFNCAHYLQQQPNVRVLIFDGSDSWLYGFNKIPTFNISENDITINQVKTSLDIEQFTFNNWALVKFALRNYKDVLFRLKTKSPSKRGFAVRQIVNFLDDLQRQEKEQSPTHENKQSIAFFCEEFENCFSNRQTLRLDAENFKTAFNEARNFSEAFFTCQQYEQDSAKTLRVKQVNGLGQLNETQKMPYHRKLERELNINLSDMKPRTWLIGEKLITVPTWTQSGKPIIINRLLREKFNSQQPQPQKQGLIARFKNWREKYNKAVNENKKRQLRHVIDTIIVLNEL